MKIRKGDQVLIMSGKDRGKKGKVLKVFPTRRCGYPSRVLVEGVNLRKKHQKPKKSGEKGQVILLPSFIAVSNVKLICSKCGKSTRVGYKILEKNKVRICKKCNQEV